MPTERDKDQELEDYLANRDGLAQTYRSAAGEEPPAHLDGAILAASRKAVGAKPRRMFTRWHVPVSLAAVLVLSVLVVFNLPEERASRTYVPAADSNAVEDFAESKMEAGAAPGETEEAAADAVKSRQPFRRPAAPAPAQSQDEAASGRERRVLRFEAETPALMESTPADPAATAQDGRSADADILTLNICTTPRPEACTMEYRPVCAVKETPAGTENSGYSNACQACSDPAVTGYTPGVCGEESP